MRTGSPSWREQEEGLLSLPFTRRTDRWIYRIIACAGLTMVLSIVGLYYYGPPEYTRVGYAPTQPVAFSHAQHVGQLGMSCVYCHTRVEESPHANVPSTQTCMNCHQSIKPTSPLLAEVRARWADGQPVAWRRVHKLPDYVYFNHAVHVRRGVGCVSCHGRVDEMPVVVHEKPLSMGWCLDCHRHPENEIRPLDEVTNLTWSPPDGEDRRQVGERWARRRAIGVQEQCSSCHR